ncbi:MAG: GNAT family N-acetyltransferase [Candidatus Omnitrophica bacterium]|nr:GNAT family N-acetyltransferase [Candidatus Omnitrophota bacterium]
MPHEAIIYRTATPEEIYDLRWRVLIAGTQRDSPEFPGDFHPETLHIGAFAGEAIIGCASFIPSEWDGKPAWRLRGMATDPDWRNRGVGRALFRFGEQEALKAHVWPFWCDARVSAVEFYLKQGWNLASEEFFVEAVGPHRKMVKSLPVPAVSLN